MSKQIELAMQTTYENGRWHFTVQAWVGTQGGADALIKTLEVIRPLLAENAAAEPVST